MATITVTADHPSHTGTSAADIFNDAQLATGLLDGRGGIDTLTFDAALVDGNGADDVSASVDLETATTVPIANAEILVFTNGTIDLTRDADQYLTVATGTDNQFSADTLLAYRPGAADTLQTLDDLTLQSINGQEIEDREALSLGTSGSVRLDADAGTLTFTAFSGYARSLGYGETGTVDLEVTYLDGDTPVTLTHTATVAGTFSNRDDVYRASSTENDDTGLLDGLGGDDTISGDQNGDDIYGGAGNDRLFAGPLDTGVNGAIPRPDGNEDRADFDDAFAGGAGNDALYGGDGDDLLTGDDDSRLAGDGTADGADTLFGGAGNDEIHTGSWNGTTSTGTADDLAFGGDGDDLVAGAGGDDTLGGGRGDDFVTAGDGDDRLFGGTDAGDDTLSGSTGNDTLYGGTGSDSLSGGADDDLIFNGAGTDQVLGNSGSDTLWGGAGDDFLSGGTDSDVFAFVAGNGTDVIADFETGSDRVDLSALGLDETDLDGMFGEINGETALFYADGDAIVFANGASVDTDDLLL